MYSSVRPLSSAYLASSWADAMHISSVMVFARTSSAPLKMAGNTRLLFTWLGKSLLPVAMTFTPASFASQGHISGTGLAQANSMGSSAINLMSSGLMVPGPGFEAARAMSLPLNASLMSPVLSSPLVFRVISHLYVPSSSFRLV